MIRKEILFSRNVFRKFFIYNNFIIGSLDEMITLGCIYMFEMRELLKWFHREHSPLGQRQPFIVMKFVKSHLLCAHSK